MTAQGLIIRQWRGKAIIRQGLMLKKVIHPALKYKIRHFINLIKFRNKPLLSSSRAFKMLQSSTFVGVGYLSPNIVGSDSRLSKYSKFK